MILLHHFDGTPVYFNVAHIVSIDVTHDTVLTLFGGQKARIMESAQEVVDAIHAHAKAMGLPWVHPRLDPDHAAQEASDDDESETF